MNRRARQAGEIVAGAAVLALAALLAVPAARRMPVERAAVPQAVPAPGAEPSRARAPEPAPPERIAALFGWRPAPPAAAPPQPAAAAPLPADWLAYLGFVADSGGGERFLYKDRRTGRVVTVSAGESGWRLVEARANELIVEHEGKLYALKRGK